MRNNQSLIDMIGWVIMLIMLFALFMLIFGCGSVKPTQPVYDDWAEIKAWQYGPIVEPEFKESTPKDDNLIEWHGYIIIDVGDSLIVLKNQ